MADEQGLDGLDPYDLQDRECERLAAWFWSLQTDDWAVASACEGWSRRDLLAHLVAVEEYFDACLNWTVNDLMMRYVSAGARSLDEFNAAGVAAAGSATGPELLATWIDANATNRAGFREANGGDIDTSVGAYSGRLQAFHVAFEYAIHGDDVDAPVGSDERDQRQDWLAAVARFALTEMKSDVTVEPAGDGFVVRRGDLERTFDRDTFVAGVAGRAGDGISADDAGLLGEG